MAEDPNKPTEETPMEDGPADEAAPQTPDTTPDPAEVDVSDSPAAAEIEALASDVGDATGQEAPTAAHNDESELESLADQIAQANETASAASDASEPPAGGSPHVLNTGSISVSPDAAQGFEPPAFNAPETPGATADIRLLDDVHLDVKIELGRTNMYIEDVLQLGVGSVVELNKLAGDPVDIFVNDRLIARGEVLVLNDNFCVRINDIDAPIPELESE